jgi:hypothetical protein
MTKTLNQIIFFFLHQNQNIFSNLPIWELFCESVDKALDSDLPLFLVGDYNCDMLSNSSNYFKKILNRLNLENVVFEATHFTTETGTCIDICITD